MFMSLVSFVFININSTTTMLGFLTVSLVLAAAECRLLLISLDGFRWDYLNRIPAPNHFLEIAKKGVYAPGGMKNVFITKTFPNHYALVTGLYEESHGVIANSIYNQKTGKVINLKTGSKDAEPYFKGEPIWATYVKQRPNKIEPLCIMWPGCVYNIAGVKLNYTVPFEKKSDFRTRIDWALNAFREGREFVLMYYHEPDASGHSYGPNSPEVNKTLIKLNDDIAYLQQQIHNDSLDDLNLLIVSDHGMAPVEVTVQIPTNDNLYKVVSAMDVMWQIFPKKGKLQQSLDFLNRAGEGKFWARRKEDLPRGWHYTNNKNIAPIVVVASKPGIAFSEEPSKECCHTSPPVRKGTHGFDNMLPEMRPIFIASGPAFKQGFNLTGDEFKTVDVYGVVAKAMGLQPASTNGSVLAVRKVLKEEITNRLIIVMDGEKFE